MKVRLTVVFDEGAQRELGKHDAVVVQRQAIVLTVAQ